MRSPTTVVTQQQSGFSLIEVMIAILILSVGLLGVAGLQTSSLRISHGSHLRSQATQLSYDLIARIRSNPDADYSVAIPNTADSCIGASIDCDNTAMRDFDLFTWNTAVQAQFPNAVANIALSADENIAYVITLTWYERLEGQSNNSQAPVVTPEPRIFTMPMQI